MSKSRVAKKAAKSRSPKAAAKAPKPIKKPVSVQAAPAKKAAKAAPVKRPLASPSTMRSSSRERVFRLTKEIPEHNYFVLANGRPVKHVAELAALLDQLEDHVFNHHVNADRNDFHNWIKDVFGDLELARKMAGVDNKEHLQLVIYRHLAGHD